MARFFKNPDIAKGGKLAARLPIVPSSSYGDAPTDGIIRFNQTSKRIEFYYNNAWSEVAKIGTVTVEVENVGYGDGNNAYFTMTQGPASGVYTLPTDIAVFIGGVYQQPTTNYVIGSGITDGTFIQGTGTTVKFTSPPPLGTINPTQIVVIHNINSTNVPA